MASVAKVAISGAQITSTAPMPATHTAAHAALFTGELLCNIIAHLPLKDMITARAVCRDWRGALTADPNIQQALFLAPKDIREVIAHNSHILDLEHPIPIEECTIIGEVNPWVYDICGHTHLGDSPHPSVNKEFLHRGGLWREMFVTQPPCNTIKVSMYLELYGDIPYTPEFKREAGIKMRELFDFIHKSMRRHPECRGSFSNAKNFDTEEHARDLRHLPHAMTRCKVQNGKVCRPVESSKRVPHSGFRHPEDPPESNDEMHENLGYELHESESGEEYSDEDDDPDEYLAEQADEADQYFRW